MARLHYYQAVSGNLLACLPLELKLRGKSTRQSMGTAIYYVDLTIKEDLTLNEAIEQARALDEKRKASGFEQQALDQTASSGLMNGGFIKGNFEDIDEEMTEVVEEFYPDKQPLSAFQKEPACNRTAGNPPSNLKAKLIAKSH